MKLRVRSTFGASAVAKWGAYATTSRKAALVHVSPHCLVPERALEEMRLLAGTAGDRARPMLHLVASFAPAEPITLDGYRSLMDELYIRMARQFGSTKLLYVDAAHADAYCRHGHSLVLRIDPSNGRLLPNSWIGLFLDEFAREHTPRNLERTSRGITSRGVLDAETYNGKVSFVRFLRNELSDVTSWAEHDRRLSTIGASRIEQRSGYVYVEGTPGSSVVARGSLVLPVEKRRELGPRPSFVASARGRRRTYGDLPPEEFPAPGIGEATIRSWCASDRRLRLGEFARKGSTMSDTDVASRRRAGMSDERSGTDPIVHGAGRDGRAPILAAEGPAGASAIGNRIAGPNDLLQDAGLPPATWIEDVLASKERSFNDHVRSSNAQENRIGGPVAARSADEPDENARVEDAFLASLWGRMVFENPSLPVMQKIVEDFRTVRAATDERLAALEDGCRTTDRAFDALQDLAFAQEEAAVGLALIDPTTLAERMTLREYIATAQGFTENERAHLEENIVRLDRAMKRFSYDEGLASLLATDLEDNERGLLFRDRADGHTRFEERRNHFHLADRPRDADIAAALRLAEARWGAVEIHGDQEFVERALQTAVRLGIAVSTPELQQQYQELRAAREVEALAERERSKPSLLERRYVLPSWAKVIRTLAIQGPEIVAGTDVARAHEAFEQQLQREVLLASALLPSAARESFVLAGDGSAHLFEYNARIRVGAEPEDCEFLAVLLGRGELAETFTLAPLDPSAHHARGESVILIDDEVPEIWRQQDALKRLKDRDRARDVGGCER